MEVIKAIHPGDTEPPGATKNRGGGLDNHQGFATTESPGRHTDTLPLLHKATLASLGEEL